MTNELGWKGWKKTVSDLTDELLWEKTLHCASGERERTAWLVAHLAEVIRRDLALKRGYPSVFKYAREALQLSDVMTWERVAAAQLALQLPETIEKIAEGELTLSAAGEIWKVICEKREVRTASRPKSSALQPELLVPAQPAPLPSQPMPLQMADKRELFTRVLGKTRRESEAAIGEWKQERNPSPTPPPPKRTDLGLSLSDADLAKWDHLRDLLSHRLGSRDPNAALLWLIEQGLEKLDPVRQEARAVKRREKTSSAQVSEKTDDAAQCCVKETVRQQRKPIPAALKRAVWARDQSRCQHQDPKTKRICGATAFLDLDHISLVSEGGQNTPGNLRLACSLHNRRRCFWPKEDQPLLTSRPN